MNIDRDTPFTNKEEYIQYQKDYKEYYYKLFKENKNYIRKMKFKKILKII